MISVLKNTMRKLLSPFKKQIVIPSYDYKRGEIEKYKNLFNLDILVETGTFLGDTVAHFESKFDRIYSIELSEELANKAKKRFRGNPKVSIIQGDSGLVLRELTQKLDRPCLFWLDGHYSSEFFVGDEYIITAKGDLNTPIISELKCILESPLSHVILIDDARLFVNKYDYPSLDEVKNLVGQFKNAYQYFVLNDIIYLIPECLPSLEN